MLNSSVSFRRLGPTKSQVHAMFLVSPQLACVVVVGEQVGVSPPIDGGLELSARLATAERVLEVVEHTFGLDGMRRRVLELSHDVPEQGNMLDSHAPEDRLLLVELHLGKL